MVQNFEELRMKMVDEQLKMRNIMSKNVLNAMQAVPRHLFVPEKLQYQAYDDAPLPIRLKQTISQPYMVAFMTEAIEDTAVSGSLTRHGRQKILEIGTGSGYQAAILAHLGYEVYTIELLEELAAGAKKIIGALDFNNVKIKCGNGYSGWPEEAPFDAIIVTAAPVIIPLKLIEQLKDGGKMIIPVGQANSVQLLKLIIKKDSEIIEKDVFPVRFVPMVESL